MKSFADKNGGPVIFGNFTEWWKFHCNGEPDFFHDDRDGIGKPTAEEIEDTCEDLFLWSSSGRC